MDKEEGIFIKKHLRIVITDSGLGGLNVQALLDNKLRKLNIGISVELIYYNSLADRDYGYNTMKTIEEKVRVFDSALEGINDYNPDVILIACNTLSVIYPLTKFAKSSKIIVHGIVNVGVDLIIEQLQSKIGNVILFGTETTISSKQHELKLTERKIDNSLIVPQACRSLESEIQNDSESPAVVNLITKYVDEAKRKIIYPEYWTYAAFCCTHYSYSRDIFGRILGQYFNNRFMIIDPNEKMADIIVKSMTDNNSGEILVRNSVISRVEISGKEIESLGNKLGRYSKNLVKSLINYELKKDLFSVYSN